MGKPIGYRGEENLRENAQAHLLRRIRDAVAFHRGEIGYLEELETFVGVQEVDHLEGNLGTMVSRALSFLDHRGRP